MGQAHRRKFLIAAGGLFAVPLAYALLAQQKRPIRLGLLLLAEAPVLTDPLWAALQDRGWVRGKTLQVESRVTSREPGRAHEMAGELLRNGADILVTVGTANAVAARRASTTAPIVMLTSGYPVESGLANSLARPAGNVTGLSIYAGTQIFGKYVAFLKELVPHARTFGIFWGYAPPAFPQSETELCIGELRRAAEALGIAAWVWMNPDEIHLQKSITAAAGVGVDALFVSAGGAQSVPEGIARLAAFSEQQRIPAVCDVAGNFFHAGGVLAYSVDFRELGVRAASFVERISAGAKAGDLPIEQPTRFDLVVNLKRAKAIGVAVPQSLLSRADRVIE